MRISPKKRDNANTPRRDGVLHGGEMPPKSGPPARSTRKKGPPKTCSARIFQAIVPENFGGVFSLCFVHLLRSSAFNPKKMEGACAFWLAEVFVWLALPACCLFGCCWICEPEAAPLEAHMGRNRPSGGFSEGPLGAPVGDSGFGPKFSGRRFFFTLLLFCRSEKC